MTLLARFSGQSNELGFYYTYRSEHPLSFGGLRLLISSTAPIGFSTEFTASHEFGLYLNSIADAAHTLGGLFWTEHRYNWDKRSHAKIYSVGYDRWVIGWEDWADFDYNDMIVLIERVEAFVYERTIFSDSFDSYPDGSLPYGWEVVWGGIDYGVSSRYSVSGKSFRLRGRDHWTCGIQRRFSSDARLIGYEFDVMIEGWGNRGKRGRGGDHADNPGFFCGECATWGAYYASVLFVHRDGSIKAEDGTLLGSWVPGRWYHVRVLLDRQANTYSVWIDGRLVGINLRTKRSDTYNIKAFILISGWSETNVYYDNVKVFEFKPG
ncbi:MAG: hypothetical protein DRJ41_02180 [Thermoprotei archaeon]|nr:MAG: hypothetical protein DRJ41_02180 [Thermoprotei archaeon]